MAQPTLAVRDANNTPQTIFTISPAGRAAAAEAQAIALSTEDKAVVDAIAASLAGQLKVGTTLVSASAGEFTRPANTTAYAVNDVVGPAVAAVQSFTLARVNAGSGYVVKGKLMTDQAACVAQMRLHLFTAAPTAIADNSPFTLLYADAATYMGYLDFPALDDEGAGSTGAQATWVDQPFPFVAGAGTQIVYGVLVTKTAFTPASGQKFLASLVADQN